MPGSRWTNAEISSLIEQVVEDKRSLPDIVIPGKSRAAINNQRRRLQHGGFLNGSFDGRHIKPWTFPELKKLTGLTQEYGFSASMIAQMELLPGRSKDSISKMMGRHGLGNPAVKARARAARRLDSDHRNELEQFLLGPGRLLSSREVARQWKIAQKTVSAYRRRLGIQLSWHEARTSQEFQRHQERRTRAFVDFTRRRWTDWRARKRLAWERLKRELAQRPDSPPPRVCETCGEQWFACREFFHARTRRSAGRTRASFCRVCRLCRAEQRRAHAADTGSRTDQLAMAGA